MSKICVGCGISLQSEDKNKLGYIPFDKARESEYCQRCFRLIHYGENKEISNTLLNEKIISEINQKARLVLFLTDFASITDETIDLYRRINKDKIFVISKSDIIPVNVSLSQIREYLIKVFHIKEPIIFTSKTKLNALNQYFQNKKNIYLIGETNAGKSSLINAIFTKKEISFPKLTTSYQSNTTLFFLPRNLGNTDIFDTPGFLLANYPLNKKTKIEEMIKPISYQNKVPCVYKIGNILEIRITGFSSVVFYFSNNIKIERSYQKKEVGPKFLILPNMDIVIRGLGFIKVTKEVNIQIPEKFLKYMSIRPSIVGGKYESN